VIELAKKIRRRRKTKVKYMVEPNKLFSISLILIGLVFIIESIGSMTIFSSLGTMFLQMGSKLPDTIILAWIYSVLKMVTGIVTFVSGFVVFLQKK
jgi:CBS domain containing-hemolysin-like protein